MSALLRARKFTYSAYVAWARSACIQTSGVGSRMKSHLDSPGREKPWPRKTSRSSGKTAPAKSLKEKRADKKDKATAKANYKEV